MTDIIFGKEAAKYFAAGIPVMPLDYHSKKPTLPGWNTLASTMPDEATQQQWIAQYPQNNIGLVLGKASNLCAIDIDSEDEKVVQAIRDALPASPWVRVGQKGMMLLYKRNDKLKNRNIADVNGEMVVEILCNSRQMVIPPSIHPDTKKPYVENICMVDVLDNLIMLPDDVEERLRVALEPLIDLGEAKGKFSATDYQSAGGRDNAMTALGGQTALEVRLGNISVVEGITRIEDWCDFNVEKVKGDELDVNKGVNNFLGFLIRDVNNDGRILPVGWDKGLTDEQKDRYGLKFSEDQKEWTYTEIMDYLKKQFETTGENSSERREGIDFILRKIVKSPGLDELAQARIIDYICKNAQDGVKVADYKREMKKISAGPLEGTDQTQIANATIAKYEERNGLLRCVSGELWRWKGDHWAEVNEIDILALIANEFGELAMAKKNGDHVGVLKIMKNILPQKLTENQPVGVNFINGFVDENMEIHPHKPEHGMTYVMPYRYLPEQAGNFPQFNQLLHGYWAEDDDYKEKVMALQEAMCATVLGLATSYQKALLFYGTGETGKSQLLDIVSSLVPPEAKSNINPMGWDKDCEVYTMKDKLLNIAGELSNKKKIQGDIFKTVISGDETTARKLYANPVTFRPKAAHWFASNYLPLSTDTSEGFFRRWQFFEFTREIPDNEKILDFGKKIVATEMEAIMAWALDGYVRLKEQSKYTQPESHLKLVSEMANENSSVRYFLGHCDRLVYGSGQVSNAELYNAYWSYMPSTGLRAVSTRKFATEISMMHKKNRKFDIIDRDGETYYVGIKIAG